MHRADEVAEHLLGHFEVRDHAVPERPHGDDVGRRAAHHALRLRADREDLLGRPVDRDHGRLVDDDAPPFDHHQGVRRPQVDRDVVREEPEEAAERIRKRQGREPVGAAPRKAAAGLERRVYARITVPGERAEVVASKNVRSICKALIAMRQRHQAHLPAGAGTAPPSGSSSRASPPSRPSCRRLRPPPGSPSPSSRRSPLCRRAARTAVLRFLARHRFEPPGDDHGQPVQHAAARRWRPRIGGRPRAPPGAPRCRGSFASPTHCAMLFATTGPIPSTCCKLRRPSRRGMLRAMPKCAGDQAGRFVAHVPDAERQRSRLAGAALCSPRCHASRFAAPFSLRWRPGSAISCSTVRS